MEKIRITVIHNPNDPADDLRWAARIRRDLWAHSPVEIDPGSSVHGTHRDSESNAYFEFATDRKSEVDRVIRELGYQERARVDVVEQSEGTECVNCGNISPQLFTVCPTCEFRDIEPCPNCNQEIARLAYLNISGDLFKCPMCHNRVRLAFNDPVFDSNGHYIQPLVRVCRTESPTEHEV